MSATTMTKGVQARLAMPFLMAWHGLFAGAYTIAFIAAEGSLSMHRFAGYATLALLGLRLGIALVARQGSPLGLPWATAGMWSAFLRKLWHEGWGALSSRHPLFPLSALAVLVGALLAALAGLLVDAVDAEDLHEGLANLSLVAVAVHIAIMVLAQVLRSVPQRAGERAAG